MWGPRRSGGCTTQVVCPRCGHSNSALCGCRDPLYMRGVIYDQYGRVVRGPVYERDQPPTSVCTKCGSTGDCKCSSRRIIYRHLPPAPTYTYTPPPSSHPEEWKDSSRTKKRRKSSTFGQQEEEEEEEKKSGDEAAEDVFVIRYEGGKPPFPKFGESSNPKKEEVIVEAEYVQIIVGDMVKRVIVSEKSLKEIVEEIQKE